MEIKVNSVSAISTDDVPHWYVNIKVPMLLYVRETDLPEPGTQWSPGLSLPQALRYLILSWGVLAAADATLVMTQTAEWRSRVPEQERPNLQSQLFDEFARQCRLLKKEEKPVEKVFRKPVESTTHLKQLAHSDRSLTITEWVNSLTDDDQDQLSYDLGCWWETRKLWQRMFVLWVYEPLYGLSDYWTGAECPRLVVTMWERCIQHNPLLEQGSAIHTWIDGISEAEQSNLDKEVSDWWNPLRLDQQAGAYRLWLLKKAE